VALLGDQRKIDANKDGEITAKDFEMLREQRRSGGLLDDDMMRMDYANGEEVGDRKFKVHLDMLKTVRDSGLDDVAYDEMIMTMKDNPNLSGFKNRHSEFDRFLVNDKEQLLDFLQNRNKYLEREQKAEGGEMDEMEGLPFAPEYEMEEENEMLPDEEMEQNFIDFIVDEALSEEEESMLMEQLEANPELSMVFDKVIEKASEFTGAGPVDGPGTGTSDDIPARLSDGEFVFTAKAVEQIGADNLMQMMKDAEAAYDAGGEREAMQDGGEIAEDDKKVTVEYVQQQQPMTAEQSLLGQVREEDETATEIKKSMMSPFGHVRS